MAPKKPCFAFQKGQCKFGDKCKYEHAKNSARKTQACKYFAEGKCYRGGDCKWSHDPEDIAALKANPPDPRIEAEKKSTEAKFRRWQRWIPDDEDVHKAKNLGSAMSEFIQTAHALSSGQAGITQEVISSLASAGGLKRVEEILEYPSEGVSDSQLSRIFGDYLLPFFEMLSRPNVTLSPIMEKWLGTIFNYIYGIGGQRAVAVFQSVTRHLSTLELTFPGGAINEDNVAAFEHSLAVLAKVVQINTPAQAHEGLVPIVETLSALLEDPASDAVSFALMVTKRHLGNLQKRLRLGQELPTAGDKKAAPCTVPKFALAKDLPGDLSEEGPRHDNDKHDIREISILPTVQEIQSARNEYLPTADPREWHIGGLEGLLDRNFRLLREDTVGQLRDAAKLEFERLQNPRAHADAQRRRQGARTNVYENAALEDVAFDPHAGLEFAFSFDQPQHLRAKSEKNRQEWWEASKKLDAEGLICLLGSDGSAMFFVVSPEPRESNAKDEEVKHMAGRLHRDFDLFSNRDRAHVILQLVKKEDLPMFVRRVVGNQTAKFSIVHFPGVLLPAFMPTLQSMQRMSSSHDLPFADMLCRTSTPDNPDRDIDLPPPSYAMRPGFRFDLSSLTDEDAEIHLNPRRPVEETIRPLQAYTTLDAGQAEALASSLSRSLALIQGPPGTGKSHTGLQILRSLLANKGTINMGPILCVTYTNHALDQVLERSVDNGIKQIVRIGGRSKSDRLADLNLRIVARGQDLTKTEKHDRWKQLTAMEKVSKEINRILVEFQRLGHQSQVKEFLKTTYRRHHDQLFGEEADNAGWQKVRNRRAGPIDDWLDSDARGTGAPRDVEELQELHIEMMSKQERLRLHRSWTAEMKLDALNRLKRSLRTYEAAKSDVDLIRTEVDLRVLRQADIIGVTTSGLARNIDLLRRTNAKILVCEEAGEVLEAHLLTALLPSVEHAILIGDHQQLRPQVQNYDLSSESRNGAQYSLDISLFERLVQPTNVLAQPLPYSTLGVQRRMHPSISDLIRRTIYPHLIDAPSVSDYPQVSGLKDRLFWFDHSFPEGEVGEAQSTSRTNDFEVEMVAALVSHLVKQGIYSAGDIAVITPYLGQLRKIRNNLSSSFEILLNDRDMDALAAEGEELIGITHAQKPTPRTEVARGTLLSTLRVATVDAYQGEEAKIVVVSLVRSNDQNKPGFLKTANRINVLLSRAKHGLYLIGNSRTMSSVKMWSDVQDMLRANNIIGTSLDLSCPRHPDTPLSVSVPDDFMRVAPEAGCDLICNDRLPCGHADNSKCHSELLHNAVYCLEPCTRPPRGCSVHVCPNPCGSACPSDCYEIVEDISVKPPNCDHEKTSLPCYQVRDPSKIECEVDVTRKVNKCGHDTTVPCHWDVNSPTFLCSERCGSALDCGHTCKKKCFSCRKIKDDGTIVIDHGVCNRQCGRKYTTCAHSDSKPCHGKEECPPCRNSCEVRCSHSACNRKCFEGCVPCAEPDCSTAGCTMPCAAPCNSLPASTRCSKALRCGCRCPSVHGEVCPEVEFCQKCGKEENLGQPADYIEFKAYRDIDLDEEPCIFATCGHIFTVSSLDGIMDMAKFYEIDPRHGRYNKIKATAEPFSSDELKTCPACRGSLRDIARYGRIVRRAVLDESVKKLTVWANRKHIELGEQVIAEQARLLKDIDEFKKPNQQHIRIDGSSANQLRTVKSLRTSKRYRETSLLLKDIRKFVDKLRQEEQPYQRIQDLVETARRQKFQDSIDKFDFDSSELQLREYVQASSLAIRCEIVLFSDVINVHHKTPVSSLKGTLSVNFDDNRCRCDILIKEAKAAMSVLQEAEGHVFWATFAALECGSVDYQATQDDPAALQNLEEHKDAGFARLEQAKEICDKLGETAKDLANEVEEVHRMLEHGTSESEMRMVVAAMAREFSGTGHWYRCANNHPFTVGECGMPMELAKCPACGAGIGGQSHRPTEGVQHARDIERDFGAMNLGD